MKDQPSQHRKHPAKGNPDQAACKKAVKYIIDLTARLEDLTVDQRSPLIKDSVSLTLDPLTVTYSSTP